MSETPGEYPSQAAMEAAFERMGLADAPETVLNDDAVAYQQFELAKEIEDNGDSTQA